MPIPGPPCPQLPRDTVEEQFQRCTAASPAWVGAVRLAALAKPLPAMRLFHKELVGVNLALQELLRVPEMGVWYDYYHMTPGVWCGAVWNVVIDTGLML